MTSNFLSPQTVRVCLLITSINMMDLIIGHASWGILISSSHIISWEHMSGERRGNSFSLDKHREWELEVFCCPAPSNDHWFVIWYLHPLIDDRFVLFEEVLFSSCPPRPQHSWRKRHNNKRSYAPWPLFISKNYPPPPHLQIHQTWLNYLNFRTGRRCLRFDNNLNLNGRRRWVLLTTASSSSNSYPTEEIPPSHSLYLMTIFQVN